MNLNDLGILSNPRGTMLRKWMAQLLADRYPKYDLMIERMGHSMVTNQEVEQFTKMAVDLYELGYLKCMRDCESKLAGMGIKVQVVAEDKANGPDL